MPHQSIAPLKVLQQPGSPYEQAYRETPDNPHRQVLVIGAGNGNDVAVALANGARSVDAVEIDPRLQEIGAQLHPARPYDNPRVHATSTTAGPSSSGRTRKYDLIVLALPDSLTLVPGASNLRLESYLFTKQAFSRRVTPRARRRVRDVQLLPGDLADRPLRRKAGPGLRARAVHDGVQQASAPRCSWPG